MAAVNAQMLHDVAYPAACAAGLKGFELYVEKKLRRGEKWYIVRIMIPGNSAWKCKETCVYYKRAKLSPGARRYVMQKFAWLVQQKAAWLLQGKRVKHQSFFDSLWYTASWELNNHPYCARWLIMDHQNGDRDVVVHWASNEHPVIRKDIFKLYLKDFQHDGMGVYDAFRKNLYAVESQVTAHAHLCGLTPLEGK